jgi:hypothetical protein
LLFSLVSRPLWGPIQWILVTKQQGSEGYHSLECSAEVKNGGAVPLLPPMSSRYGVYVTNHRDKFTLYLLSCYIGSFIPLINRILPTHECPDGERINPL